MFDSRQLQMSINFLSFSFASLLPFFSYRARAGDVMIFLLFFLGNNHQASVVQWLGFHPSKVEVRVRFTSVANAHYFWLFFLLFWEMKGQRAYLFVLFNLLYYKGIDSSLLRFSTLLQCKPPPRDSEACLPHYARSSHK